MSQNLITVKMNDYYDILQNENNSELFENDEAIISRISNNLMNSQSPNYVYNETSETSHGNSKKLKNKLINVLFQIQLH